MDAIAKSIQYSCCPVDSEGGKQKINNKVTN